LCRNNEKEFVSLRSRSTHSLTSCEAICSRMWLCVGFNLQIIDGGSSEHTCLIHVQEASGGDFYADTLSTVDKFDSSFQFCYAKDLQGYDFLGNGICKENADADMSNSRRLESPAFSLIECAAICSEQNSCMGINLLLNPMHERRTSCVLWISDFTLLTGKQYRYNYGSALDWQGAHWNSFGHLATGPLSTVGYSDDYKSCFAKKNPVLNRRKLSLDEAGRDWNDLTNMLMENESKGRVIEHSRKI